VQVGNRGTQTASGVTVRVWYATWPADAQPPDWNDPAAGWTECGNSPSPAQDIPPNSSAEFASLTLVPPTDRYILLAAAGCATDRANVDTATMRPCATQRTALVDLVSGDNNLGLRVLGA
jgi:hypothetical protein